MAGRSETRQGVEGGKLRSAFDPCHRRVKLRYEKIGYYNEGNAPYPVHKTKLIIGMHNEDEIEYVQKGGAPLTSPFSLLHCRCHLTKNNINLFAGCSLTNKGFFPFVSNKYYELQTMKSASLTQSMAVIDTISTGK